MTDQPVNPQMTPTEFRAIREATVGRSQAAFGAMLGITRTQVSRLEGGATITPSMALAVRAIAIWGPPETWPDPPARESAG